MFLLKIGVLECPDSTATDSSLSRLARVAWRNFDWPGYIGQDLPQLKQQLTLDVERFLHHLRKCVVVSERADDLSKMTYTVSVFESDILGRVYMDRPFETRTHALATVEDQA